MAFTYLDEAIEDLGVTNLTIANMKTNHQPCIMTSRSPDNIFSLAQLLIDSNAISETTFETITSEDTISAKEMVGRL